MAGPGQQPMPERRAAVRVLDAVPELADEISDDRLEGARRHALAATIELAPGRWQASASDLGEQSGYGLLVVDGLMTRDIVLGQTTASELVGAGDLLRPNDNEGAVAPVQFDIAWNVLEPTRLAVLDRRFLIVADRWGKVTKDGIVIPLKLTHQVLGRIVGAQRPSVTTALKTLTDRGALERAADGAWVLHGEPPDEYRRISEPHHRVIEPDELPEDADEPL